MHATRYWIIPIAIGFPFASVAETPAVQQIVARSVAATDASWKAAPGYCFTERDVESKRGNANEKKTNEVMTIDGSPYERLIAVDDHPLSKAQDLTEQRKLEHAIEHRRNESPAQRARRLAKYQKERRQDHAMMSEMAKALTYRLVGEGTLDGHDVYILDATPNPDYVPTSRETRVLTGMKGRLWIDKHTYQWVKVQAEVFRPVEFGFFIAKVDAGTRFELEQAPVPGGPWLPTHFGMKVNASVLGFVNENSRHDETYSNYKPNSQAVTALARK